MTPRTEKSEKRSKRGTLPQGQRCPIGPLNLHTFNFERDECIWCGPNALATKPGRWVPIDGGHAWSTAESAQGVSR